MKAICSPDHLYPGLYDSHCHLFHLRQQGLDICQVLRRWRQGGLHSLLNIVLELDSEAWCWHQQIAGMCREGAGEYPRVLLAVGLHPCDAEGKDLECNLQLLAQRFSAAAVHAVGETGLDYYRSEQNKGLQQKSLDFHIQLAQQWRKVLVIHNRNSDDDILEQLCRAECVLPAGGIMHCFSGNQGLIEPLLERGFYFSFAGNVSYKNAENLRLAVQRVPLERLLIETDAPFLAPQPVRGQINHPGFIGHTLDVLAECRNLCAEDLLSQLQENWHRLFPCLD